MRNSKRAMLQVSGLLILAASVGCGGGGATPSPKKAPAQNPPAAQPKKQAEVIDLSKPIGEPLTKSKEERKSDAVVERLNELDANLEMDDEGRVTAVTMPDNVTDKDLKDLHELKHLQSLTLDESKVSDDGLQEVLAIPSLRVLRLNGAKGVTPAGLKRLRQSSSLRVLELAGLRLDDSDAAELSRIGKLEELNLSWTQLTNDAVQHLRKLPKLKALDLSCTRIDDRALPQLAQLKELEYLNVDGLNVRAATVAALKKQLPKLEVDGVLVPETTAKPITADKPKAGGTKKPEEKKPVEKKPVEKKPAATA